MVISIAVGIISVLSSGKITFSVKIYIIESHRAAIKVAPIPRAKYELTPDED